MSTRTSAVAVGLLVVASLAAVIIGVAFSNRGIGSGPGTYGLHASFDDVTGIATGTKVTIAGVRVGEVEHLELKGQRVDVKLRLLDTVSVYGGLATADGKLKNAAALTRLQASLLGDYYLELAPGIDGKKLKPNDEIPIVITATAMQQTLQKMDKAAEIVPKIDQIASDIAKITHNAAAVLGSESGADKIGEITQNLVNSSRNLAETTGSLRDRLSSGVLAPGGQLDRGLQGFADTAIKLSELSDKLDGVMARASTTIDTGSASLLRSLDHVEVVTSQVRDLIGRNKAGVDDTVGTVTNVLKKAQEALAKLDRVLASADLVAADVAAGKGNVGRLLKDETLIRESEQIMSSSANLLKRYIDLEMGVDYRLAAHAIRAQEPGARAWQSHLSLRMQPNDQKYVLLTVHQDNLPVSRSFARVTNSAGGTDPPQLTETFTETESGVRFGLQYARRFGALTLRGGLIENAAGGGVDLDLIRHKLAISADVFRFTEGPLPRLRVSAMWHFLPHLYAWVGGDELLFPRSRADFFYGMGLSFTDNDLLILFSAAPSVGVK